MLNVPIVIAIAIAFVREDVPGRLAAADALLRLFRSRGVQDSIAYAIAQRLRFLREPFLRGVHGFVSLMELRSLEFHSFTVQVHERVFPRAAAFVQKRPAHADARGTIAYEDIHRARNSVDQVDE